jgi:hypothetical protein
MGTDRVSAVRAVIHPAHLELVLKKISRDFYFSNKINLFFLRKNRNLL